MAAPNETGTGLKSRCRFLMRRDCGPLPRSVDVLEDLLVYGDRLLSDFDEGHCDAGAEQLQRDFFAVGEPDAVAICTVLEPRENHLFFGLHAEPSLQIARDIFELETGVILDAYGCRAVALRGEADASRGEAGRHISLSLARWP